MKRMQIVVPDDVYEELRGRAFKEKTSMSKLLLGEYQGEVGELYKVAVPKNHPAVGLCKHGSRKGLCKFNCK